ncbi:MAG TPA: cupin domain-containing protein, partial [Kofleriaceae bacterium]|nr:cupin domain-containing protein [Kofleriaceae bacterium]
FLPAAKAKAYGKVTIFAEPTTTKQTAISASLLEVAAGASVPEHVHTQETEALYMLAGAGTMTVAGTKLAVTASTVIQIPPNTKHSFTASGDVRAVQFYTPAGPEQRFKQSKP